MVMLWCSIRQYTYNINSIVKKLLYKVHNNQINQPGSKKQTKQVDYGYDEDCVAHF